MDMGSRKVAFHSPCTLQHGMKIEGPGRGNPARAGARAHARAGRAPLLRLGRHVLDPAARAFGASSRPTSSRRSRRGEPDVIATANIGCLSILPTAPPPGPALDRAARCQRMVGGFGRRRHSAPRAANHPRNEPVRIRPPQRPARGLSPLPRDPDALDGQRQLRAREQRHLLLLLRHRGQRASDPRRRPRHRPRGRPSASSSRRCAGSGSR